MFAFQELEEQLAEQKKLLQSVASRGEEILIQQASPSSLRYFTYHQSTTVCNNVHACHDSGRGLKISTFKSVCFFPLCAVLWTHFHPQLWLSGSLRLLESR